MKTIGYGAFAGCNLTSIIIPRSVIMVEDGAFARCTALKNVKFGKGIEEIPYCAFGGCSSLESIEIPLMIEGEGC